MPERRGSARSDVEAAYFALLRARRELDEVRRYGDYLRGERRRLQRFVGEGDALQAHVGERLRRPLRHTDRLLSEALRARHAVIDEELEELPDRLEAVEAFVEESEQEYRRLRGGE